MKSARPVGRIHAQLLRTREMLRIIPLQPGSAAPTTLFAMAPHGAYRLSIRGGGEGDDAFVLPQELDVTVGALAVELAVDIEHGGHLVVTVRDRDDRMVYGHCKLIAGDGSELVPVFRTGRAGRMHAGEPWRTVQPIRAGRYDAVFALGQHGTHRRVVDIEVAKTTEVTIRLP